MRDQRAAAAIRRALLPAVAALPTFVPVTACKIRCLSRMCAWPTYHVSQSALALERWLQTYAQPLDDDANRSGTRFRRRFQTFLIFCFWCAAGRYAARVLHRHFAMADQKLVELEPVNCLAVVLTLFVCLFNITRLGVFIFIFLFRQKQC